MRRTQFGLGAVKGDFFKIGTEILAFIFSKDAQRKADQRPQMGNMVTTFVVLGEFMDLGMAVVAPGDTVVGAGVHDLVVLELAELKAFFLETGLEKTAPAATAIIIRAVGHHIDKVFFPYH